MQPNVLSDYLYLLATKFHTFYSQCHVIGHPREKERMVLCGLTRQVLLDGFDTVGLRALESM
jgi:arginyl-tRNA synthetase